MKLKTNNRRIPIISGYELPEKAKADFDYYETLDELYQASFFKYKGQYWDLAGFALNRIPRNSEIGHWDGSFCLTMFSWLFVRIVEDGDAVIVAYCYE